MYDCLCNENIMYVREDVGQRSKVQNNEHNNNLKYNIRAIRR